MSGLLLIGLGALPRSGRMTALSEEPAAGPLAQVGVALETWLDERR